MLIDPLLRVPADVRRTVAAEGACTWRRAVPGGVIVLETRRRGATMRTALVGVEPGPLDAASLAPPAP